MFPLYFLYDLWALLALRIALGIILIAHGWPKLRNREKSSANFEAMGFRPGRLFSALAGVLEFFGGILLIVGLGITWVLILLMLEFVIILFWKWSRRTPLVGQYGWEFDLIILTGLFVLFSLGGGAWSLDRALFGIL